MGLGRVIRGMAGSSERAAQGRHAAIIVTATITTDRLTRTDMTPSALF